MKKVLLLNGQYLPGYKGGGPIQSSANMIENLSDQCEFCVLCADRDYKETKPYDSVTINDWNQVGSAKVFYLSPERQTLKGFCEFLNSTDYDMLYLNGYFSPVFTIKPLLLRLFGKLKNKNAKVVLASRGDFSGGCENKKLKKYSYIYLSRLIGLYRNIVWHASTELEKRDILKKFPKAEVRIAENLPAKYVVKQSTLEKRVGKLKLVFVSRIFPKKNLKYALEVLKEIHEGEVLFDIYGPLEDQEYWKECKEVIDKLPDNIFVQYKGELKHSQIGDVFSEYHAFFFPTLGENYGHVIVEAMMNNCPCIISKDTTPWNGYIEATRLGAMLGDKNIFADIINRLLEMDDNSFDELQKISSEYLKSKLQNDRTIEQYMELLK